MEIVSSCGNGAWHRTARRHGLVRRTPAPRAEPIAAPARTPSPGCPRNPFDGRSQGVQSASGVPKTSDFRPPGNARESGSFRPWKWRPRTTCLSPTRRRRELRGRHSPVPRPLPRKRVRRIPKGPGHSPEQPIRAAPPIEAGAQPQESAGRLGGRGARQCAPRDRGVGHSGPCVAAARGPGQSPV